jgi:uncharacterized protein YegL
MLCKLPKPVTFAIAGAVGCLIAAVCIGEPLHLLLEPDAPPTPKVDVMFVLDATASMQYAIDGTKSGIQKFADKLQNRNLDARVGLVAFRDRVWHPPQLDIAFVLDVTHSMQDEIDGVRDGIDDFATSLETAGLDAHIGLVAFRDRLYTPPKVDVTFVLDVSSSMEGEIRGVRDGIESFASSLEESGLDVQIGLVAFCNSDRANAIQTLAFKDGFLTKNFTDFRRQVSGLRAFGGGTDESSYLGLHGR